MPPLHLSGLFLFARETRGLGFLSLKHFSSDWARAGVGMLAPRNPKKRGLYFCVLDLRILLRQSFDGAGDFHLLHVFFWVLLSLKSTGVPT